MTDDSCPPDRHVDETVRLAALELVAVLHRVEHLLQNGDVEAARTLVFEGLDICLAKLAETNVWGPQNLQPSNSLWQLVGDQLQFGWLQNRARTKPRGFAGDHELLGRIIEGECCDHSLGRVFDSYFQSLAAPAAVRNRTEMVVDTIVQRCSDHTDSVTTIAVVGCGSAIDVERALRSLPDDGRQRVQLRLLDYDPRALEAAELRLRKLLSGDQLRCTAGPLFRLPQRANFSGELANAQLIICTGMFDYLDDSAASIMLRTFWDHLASGGCAHVFNFSPANSSRAYMEWIGNWYLIYRTPDDLRQIAAAAGIPDGCVELDCEPLGVDLLLRIAKPLE